MKPSRTFTIALLALAIEAILALVLIGVAWLAPETLIHAAPALGTIALAVAALGGAGSGAMAYRDGRSGGATSSQAAEVLALRMAERDPP